MPRENIKLPQLQLRGLTHATTTKYSRTAEDERVVLKLLEEIYQLATPSQVLSIESPRMHAAAKLYLDTRDTFEAIEQIVEEHMREKPKLLRRLSKRPSTITDSSRVDSNAMRLEPIAQVEEPNDDMIDRIQDMFRHLGELLATSILNELQHRKLTMQSILHYIRFLPAEHQWRAYTEARREQVTLAYRSLSTPSMSASEVQVLKQHAEFIKEQIRKDVDTVCLFSSNGKLTTIFSDDINTGEENVAEKFESLITDIYSSYLQSIIDTQMNHLVGQSDEWQQDLALPRSMEHPTVQHFSRPRKFRTKHNIFLQTATFEDRSVSLPVLLPGQSLPVLVADSLHLGIWWQKSISSLGERDILSIHTDESRGIVCCTESLDGQIFVPLLNEYCPEVSRRVGRGGGIAKLVGQRVLVNNGKDTVWIEVTIKEVDDRKCKLELKKSIQNCRDIGNWIQFLALNEWVNVRDVQFMMVPWNPHFRIHMGQKFRDVLEVVHSVVVEISSIFPNDDLNRKVGYALWKSVEAQLNKGEHIFARYFRSILNQEPVPKKMVPVEIPTGRGGSVSRSGSVRALVAALETTRLTPANGSISIPSTQTPAMIETTAYFDESGRYHHQHVHSNLVHGPGVYSVYERVAHHLLEETEIVGACIQANNAALSRSFVQVFQEKVSKMMRTLQSTLDERKAGDLKAVLFEYAEANRFLYVWRICRHELDVISHQKRNKKDEPNLHTEWVDRTLSKIEKTILEMIRLQMHFAHRVFFHECSSYLLPGIYEQAWTASKPWFGNTRVTYGIQFFINQVQTVFEFIITNLLPQYERHLGVHEKLHDLAVWMILDILPCLAASYDSLVVSRARATQWNMDVLYLVSGIHKLLRLLDRMITPKISTTERIKQTFTNEIRLLCLRLLAGLAIRSGPADIVIEAVMKKNESDSFEQNVDAKSELEIHINSIYVALDLQSLLHLNPAVEELTRSSWVFHSIFGDMELKKLGSVSLDLIIAQWAVLISRCSLSRESIIEALQKRHEVGDWAFPVATDADLQNRDRLLKCIQQLLADDEQKEEISSETQSDDPGTCENSIHGVCDDQVMSDAPSAPLNSPAIEEACYETNDTSEEHDRGRREAT